MSNKYVPTKWVANETIGTANIMNNIEQGIVGAYDEIEKINLQLEQVVFVMPLPTNVLENTARFQEYLDIAKNRDTKVKILFRDGDYELNTCTIYSNTEIEMSENTKLIHIRNKTINPNTGSATNITGLFFNAKPFDDESNDIVGYNGNGNIKISGGIIDAYCALIFVHGKNIEINNVKFINIKADHCAQIGACKNVRFINCEFYGMAQPASDRQYVEMIQVDYMTSKALPYWLASAKIFDNTVNDVFIVDGCRFYKGENTYAYFPTGVGSHGLSDFKNKNIIVRNCIFDDFEYAGIAINFMENVLVENNLFTTTSFMNNIRVTNSNNVTIRDNILNGGGRSVFCTNSEQVNINGLIVENINNESDYMLFGESKNINVTNVTIKNCNGANYCILFRSCEYGSFTNLVDVNNTFANSVVRAYIRENIPCKNILVKNINTSNTILITQDGVTGIIKDII